MPTRKAISLAKETYNRWDDHQATRLGASVAFYSILSFAPLLVLMTALIAIVFGHASAQGALVSEARQLMGNRGADTVEALLKNAQQPASGIFASVIAFITLLVGASSVFIELQSALNIMWDAPGQNVSGIWALVKQRLFSFGMILSVGFLLLVSLLVSAALEYAGKEFGRILPLPAFVLQSVNFVVSFLVVAALFGLMFKYVPNVQVAWRNVTVGALGTALLFTIGKFLLGTYLARAGVGSTYGAAGSLVAVVVWIYYSAQIFFFGAEFTRVYADSRDGKLGAAAASAPEKSAPSPAPVEKANPLPPRIEATAAVSTPVVVRAAVVKAPGIKPVGIKPIEIKPVGIKSVGVGSAATAGRVTVPARTAHVTKPRLLMALGLGFALGRLVRLARSRS